MTTKKLFKGDLVTVQDIKSVRPCPKNALPPFMKSKIVGKKINRDLEADSHFLMQDLY